MILVAKGFDFKLADRLKCLQAWSMYKRCLISVIRLPIDLRFCIGLKDREKYRMPITIIDNCLGW